MKTLVTAFACAALAAGSMITAPAAFAQTTTSQAVVTTTTHTSHYGYGYARRTYGYRRHVAYKPCGTGYGSCGPYLAGRSAETGEPVDMDYQAPIGEPIYANGDVAINCSCDRR